jgi:hypothetical protein
MTGGFDSDQWHLAGSLQLGFGRAWLVTNHGLDDRWGQGPWHTAASTRAVGLRWLREQLDEEHGSRVPVRLDERHDGRLVFVYVNRAKYAGNIGQEEEES